MSRRRLPKASRFVSSRAGVHHWSSDSEGAPRNNRFANGDRDSQRGEALPGPGSEWVAELEGEAICVAEEGRGRTCVGAGCSEREGVGARWEGGRRAQHPSQAGISAG